MVGSTMRMALMAMVLMVGVVGCRDSQNERRDSRVSAGANGEPVIIDNGTPAPPKPAAPSGTPSEPLESTTELIVPGVRIAHVEVGRSLESMDSVLGRPDSSDGAAGHVMAFWNSRPSAGGKSYQLSIYAGLDTGARFHEVRDVRVTSPRFATSTGIATGSTLKEILHAFPAARAVAEYRERGGTFRIYDDRKHGIGFDVERSVVDSLAGRCVAITIHKPGTQLAAEYLALHDYTWRGAEAKRK